MTQKQDWLPLDIAVEKYGYAHKESLRRRLRQLRECGRVIDVGRPPAKYRDAAPGDEADIVLMWPNPKVVLIGGNSAKNLLKSRRGRPRKNESVGEI